MKIFFFIFYFLLVCTNLSASDKKYIINKLNNIDNLSFNFIQSINKKKEIGKCLISFPKKIYCEYNNRNKKILVSDGKNLIIKNRLNDQIYFYPLKSTPLSKILDKEYLINNIKNLEERIIDEKFVNFTLEDEKNIINIFFDKKTLNLVGWQIEDSYRNLVITHITNLSINEKLNKDLFNLSKYN